MKTIDINQKRLKQLFTDMVNIYSPSGKENSIAGFLNGYLTGAGISVVRQEVEDGRDNLLIIPDDDSLEVVFVGHIDTVAAPDYMNYRCDFDGDRAYGLGTTDMKGGCAAMIEAFLSFKEQYSGDFPAALALVVGEEENGDGAQRFSEEHHFPWALIGEPTKLTPCFSHYGYLELELSTFGKRMHASQARKELNAVRTMLHLLLALTEHLETSREDVIYNIRDMLSSSAGFVMPERCDVALDLHVPPQFAIGDLTFEIENIAAKKLPEGSRIHESVTFSTIHAGYDLPPMGLLPEMLQSVYASLNLPIEVEAFQSDSDAGVFWGAGMKPVILGPGDLAQAHTADESVDFSEVVRAAQIYLHLLRLLAAKYETG